jgi:hypothetical protein
MGLLGFSVAVSGINPENVVSAANAASALADMTAKIPNSGGMVSWFTGDNSLANFSEQLPKLGEGLKGFSDEVAEITPENVTAAANAAKALAEMTNVIPKEDGIKQWFTGEAAISKFADELPKLGEGLKGFSDSLVGLSPDNVTAAASAAKSLAEMTSVTPKNTDKLVDFGTNLVDFGGKLKSYFDKTKEIASDTIAAASNAISSVKSAVANLDAAACKNASSALDEITTALKNMSEIDGSIADTFSDSIKTLANTNVKGMITAFDNAGPQVKGAGVKALEKFIEGLKSKESDVSAAAKSAMDKFIDGVNGKVNSTKGACTNLVTSCANAIKSSSGKFTTAGGHLGDGLVRGINSKKSSVYWAGYALGQEAVRGEKDGQKSNSPSKLTIQAGRWLGEGLIVGMKKMGSAVYAAGSNLGKTATSTISSAVSKVSAAINTDIDAQPTIRPVLDLSDVRSGAGVIGNMLSGNRSIAVNASLAGSIAASMNTVQNGGNTDVVAAIKGLRKDISGMSNNTYTINGITYDDGGSVAAAIQTLVRAAKIEGRT